MRVQVLDAQPNDAAEVAKTVSKPGEKSHLYLKLMAHHMVPDFPLDWAEGCAHVHLIRHPARVIASYGQKRAEMTLEDIGYPQQAALLDRFPGLVLDSADIRADPAAALRAICDHAQIGFDPEMLHWPKGPKPFDGAWAPHWYNAVHDSTGFAGPEGPLPDVPQERRGLLADALSIYVQLRARA